MILRFLALRAPGLPVSTSKTTGKNTDRPSGIYRTHVLELEACHDSPDPAPPARAVVAESRPFRVSEHGAHGEVGPQLQKKRRAAVVLM